MVVDGPGVTQASLGTAHDLILGRVDRLSRKWRERRAGSVPAEALVVAEHRREALIGINHLVHFNVIRVAIQNGAATTKSRRIADGSIEKRSREQRQ